jgi:hypothetical protein
VDVNNNLIFVCDCDRAGPLKREGDALFIALKETLEAKKKDAGCAIINLWNPNHVDLYYGAKKYSQSLKGILFRCIAFLFVRYFFLKKIYLISFSDCVADFSLTLRA